MIKYNIVRKLQWEYPGVYLKFLHRYRLMSCHFYQKVSILDNSILKNKNSVTDTPFKARNILFSVHWFELGGAESYALYNIRKAKELGHKCYVISTVPSSNDDIERFRDYSDEIIEYPNIGTDEDFLPFIEKYIIEKEISHVHIHHSSLMYRSLPKLKVSFPSLKIIDSTHIVEYGTGGFPEQSSYYSNYIDKHNVISSSLISFIRNRYNDIHNGYISDDKFSLTYLSSLLNRDSIKVDKSERDTFNLTFYGRIAPQKQPYFFLAVANELLAKYEHLQINIYGDGPKSYHLPKMINKSRYKSRIKYHGRCDDKNVVFNNTDLLFIPSLNEGLTLTAYEASLYGVLAVSSKVGAQSELLPPECLISLDKQFLKNSIYILSDFIEDESKRYEAIEKTRNKLTKLDENAVSINDIKSFYL